MVHEANALGRILRVPGFLAPVPANTMNEPGLHYTTQQSEPHFRGILEVGVQNQAHVLEIRFLSWPRMKTACFV